METILNYSDTQAVETPCSSVGPAMRTPFAEIIRDPNIKERWQTIRRYNFLRESTYDMTNRCNIRCEGCYYYQGDKQFAPENGDPDDWRRLFQQEKARGITYVVLAGAEPSLVPDLLDVCYRELPLGCIATNGLRRIPEQIGYRIHVSVWGNDETSRKTRGAVDMLRRQIENYQKDPRAVFVYTFTPFNLEESMSVVDELAGHDCRVTFNMFSAPVGYNGPLRHTRESLMRTRKTMLELMRDFPRHVLFTPYNVVVHTHARGLHELFSCPYPRMNPSTNLGLGRSFRQYRTDLAWDRNAACCVPDTDCDDCRHYASGSAVVTARMFRHAVSPDMFSAWLDYVDNYLAVWVMGYEKGENLCANLVDPPSPAD
jgi:MoaA/NifB/PqqE/SkfB family radical SAM enzyme